MPLAIESCPRPGTDRAFFDDRERCRQRAGAQQNGKVIGTLDREAAGNLAGAAKNGFANDGRGDHLIVEDDRKRLADILLRHLREFARTGCIETEIDTIGSLGALVEAGLGIGEVAARHKDPLFDQIRGSWLRRAVENFGVRRHPSLQRLLGWN